MSVWLAKKTDFKRLIICHWTNIFLLTIKSNSNIISFSSQIFDQWVNAVLLSYRKLNSNDFHFYMPSHELSNWALDKIRALDISQALDTNRALDMIQAIDMIWRSTQSGRRRFPSIDKDNENLPPTPPGTPLKLFSIYLWIIWIYKYLISSYTVPLTLYSGKGFIKP